MKFVPFRNNVLIKTRELPDKSAGGIILPGTTAKPNDGTIVAVGGKVLDAAPGDTVIYSRYEGVNIPLDGENYLCLPETAVHGKIVS